MEECKICMENFPPDVYQFLPCTHKMCKFCFNKIKKHVCPFCKYSFSDEFTEEEEEIFFEMLEINDEPILRKKKKKYVKKKKQLLFELRNNGSGSNSSGSTHVTRFTVLEDVNE